jgi:hypothetical protein
MTPPHRPRRTPRTSRSGLTTAVLLAIAVGLRLVMRAATAPEVGPLEPQVRSHGDGDHVIHLDLGRGMDALLQAVLAEGMLAVVGISDASPVVVIAALGRCATVAVDVPPVALLLVFLAVAIACASSAAGHPATGLQTTWATGYRHVAPPAWDVPETAPMKPLESAPNEAEPRSIRVGRRGN